MAYSNGWNDDRRPYGSEDYDREPRRAAYRQDRDDFGSSYTERSERPSYARSDWRYGGDRDFGANAYSGDRNRGQAQRERDHSRDYGSRPVSDYAYGAGGWDYELTGAYLAADDGRYDDVRYGRDRGGINREGRFGQGRNDEDRLQRLARDRAQEHRGRGPKDYTRSDERIREDVNDRLTDDPQLDASGVTVSVKGGEVTLAGMVHERGDKRHAEDLADRVSGVRHVQNNLRVHDSNYNAATASAGGGVQSTPVNAGTSRTTLS